ncbi:MAG: hypothetical protein FJ271_22085 [Planctomycetes bacterium]|nr:hypothetical protein [Planctomycetota bacterium]
MHRFTILALLALLASLALAPASHAFKPAPPIRRDVWSPSGEYVLDVNPETNVHKVHLAANRKTSLWSFAQPLGIGEVFLSDNGKVVAIVAWRFAHGEGDCVTFRNNTGTIKSYPFAEICPNPRVKLPFEPGPIGVVSFIWRNEHFLRDEIEDTFQVTTTGWHEYIFSMKTGEIVARRFLPGNVIYRLWLYVLLPLVPLGLWVMARWRRRNRQRSADAGALAGGRATCG